MNTSPNQQADWALAKRPHCARAEPSPSRARAESGSPDQPGRALTTKSHLAPRMGRACARAAPSELEPNQSRARGKPERAGRGGVAGRGVSRLSAFGLPETCSGERFSGSTRSQSRQRSRTSHCGGRSTWPIRPGAARSQPTHVWEILPIRHPPPCVVVCLLGALLVGDDG